MKIEDLPPKLRSQVEAQIGREPKRTSQRVATSGTTTEWRCATCGERFSFVSGPRGWEQHNPKHTRIEVIMR